MRTNPVPVRPVSRPPGFSLVELLTVIAIISVLMTVSVVGLNSLSGAKGVGTGVSTSEAVFEEARSLAVGRRTNAAVLISAQDPENRDTYLRRMLVVYKEVDPVTNQQQGDWKIHSRGATLPERVYFSRSLSKRNHKTGTGTIATTSLSGVGRDYSGEYYIYEFNSEGISTTPGASFVIGTGARSPGDKNPRVMASAKKDFGGFVIFRNGGTASFKDPEQIPVPNNIKTF
ncbi:MAG: prepilin-type N-terminal cleavage/methylation domain-containing protein [Akkermansiaceae bacterium]|jgi:prepilin-type N-terminal cleavage/methylation domain-containing protein|nr:prepilin-type N-terminal cleavage/methylation domain-containing protein [Akkermansiaceae bacterium]